MEIWNYLEIGNGLGFILHLKFSQKMHVYYWIFIAHIWAIQYGPYYKNGTSRGHIFGSGQERLVQVKWTELPFRFNVMKTSNYPHSYLNLNNYVGTCPILCFVVDKTDPDRSTAWYQCHRFWYHSRRAYLLPRRMEIYILNRHSRSLVFHWLWIDVLVNDLVLDRVHVLWLDFWKKSLKWANEPIWL